NEPAESRLLGSGFFDLVVIDEAHRSVYKKYRSIFDYFDALLVGLTATPKDDIDKNTYDVFGLESGVPTYAYEAEQAYADGFLVPPVCMSVPTKFMREGVHYKELSHEEQDQWEDTPELNERDQVLPSEVNRFLFNEDTVDKALKHLMTHGIKVSGGDTLGKTIIFAANNDHANFIYARFNANYPKWAGHFARVITYKEDYAESLIADFKDTTPAKDPSKPNLTIAISVDMLDTGIDVPEVVNLVFFKVIKSKVKFLQMLGRGTRLCPMLFGMDQTNPEHNKQNFMVFDFCQNLEYFELNPDGAVESKQKSLSQNIFEKRLQISTTLYKVPEEGQQQKEALVKFRDYTLALLHHQVSGMNLDNFIVRPKRQYIEKLLSRDEWNLLDKSQISDIVTHVAHLPTDANDFNANETSVEDAKPFDHLVLQMQLEYLETNRLPQALKLSIMTVAENLETKASVPNVAEHLSFIQDIQTDAYWEHITLPMMEEIRIKLRCLIQFIDKGEKKIIYTDFEDELGDGEVREVSIVYTPNSLVQYRKKIEAYIKTHESQLTIQKLKRNKPITEQDLEVLEDILFQASGMESKEAYIEFYTDTKKLGVFVRELVGLDRAAAKEAFAGFLETSSYNSRQIDFINRIIDYLTVNGVMDVGALYQAPFTDIHEDSVDGFFEDAQVVSILDTLEAINGNSYFDNRVNLG
ncbi:MAG: restriction endonuclease subunit R, partial [Methylophaga sp.]|nr:restriction endonuclease subunit R [Methylophaga sp.]